MQLLYSLHKVGAIIGAQCLTTAIEKSLDLLLPNSLMISITYEVSLCADHRYAKIKKSMSILMD